MKKINIYSKNKKKFLKLVGFANEVIDILKKLKINPAYCRKCNFVFKERSKISKPSKCPRCKSEWIEAQMFSIQ